MKLSFHGGDRGVTGSCRMVECAGHRVLIDCGLFQGARNLEEENREPFGFDPAAVDWVLLTHAHLDHCGRPPVLVQRGFRGRIVTTAASRELTRLVLLDTAHLLEEDARHRASKDARGGAGCETTAPLYSVLDALNTTEYFAGTAVYRQPFELTTGVHATLRVWGRRWKSSTAPSRARSGGVATSSSQPSRWSGPRSYSTICARA